MTERHRSDIRLHSPLVQATQTTKQATQDVESRCFPPTLELTERLRFCLLALEFRYPLHLIDVNEAVCELQLSRAEGWRASDLIELFQSSAPKLLSSLAQLAITSQRKGIYLLDRALDTPALFIYCGLPDEMPRHSQPGVQAREVYNYRDANDFLPP